MSRGIGMWLSSQHVGASSSALASAMLGYVPDREPAAPWDAGDFSRCAVLWGLSDPSEREAGLERLSAISAQWLRLKERWNEMLAAYNKDDMTRLNDLVKECFDQRGGVYHIRKDENGRWDRFRDHT